MLRSMEVVAPDGNVPTPQEEFTEMLTKLMSMVQGLSEEAKKMNKHLDKKDDCLEALEKQ